MFSSYHCCISESTLVPSRRLHSLARDDLSSSLLIGELVSALKINSDSISFEKTLHSASNCLILVTFALISTGMFCFLGDFKEIVSDFDFKLERVLSSASVSDTKEYLSMYNLDKQF